MLSEKEVWGNPSSFLPTAWWGAGMGTHSDRCLGGPLLAYPGSILISAATWALPAGQECQLAGCR